MVVNNNMVDFSRFMSQPATPRADQAKGDDAQLRQVTREFESLFIKQMLDSMYATLSPEEGLFYGGQAENIFQDMVNMERARGMSMEGGFGIADAMYDQLAAKQRNTAYEQQ